MAKPKLLVTRRWPAEVEAALAAKYDVTLNETDAPMDVSAIRDAMLRFDALAPTVVDQLPADVFKPGASARIVANYGVGVNHIDLDAAKAAGIAVTNTPGVLTDCTADIALGLMIAVARRIGEGERELRSGGWTGWRPTHMIGARIAGATLGVVGYGRIGQAVARRARHGFGMRIVVHNRSRVSPDVLAENRAVQRDDLGDVLAEADFISLNCPGGAETRHLIDAAALKRMKKSAYLVNTARGDVVDEAALVAALEAGEIAGAGLDVFQGEPNVSEALKAAPNTVLAPHLGSATGATRIAMGMRALENLDAYFEGREPPDLLT